MLEIVYTTQMKKDVKLMKKQGKDINKLIETLKMLASRQTMPPKYLDHQLIGNFKKFRECHIEPDWLLMYQILEDELILSAVRTGSHSQLLKK